MILEMDKLKAPEELKQKYNELAAALHECKEDPDKSNYYISAILDCDHEMIDAYKATFKEYPLNVLDDVREILAAIELTDFTNWVAFNHGYVELLEKHDEEEFRTYPYKNIKEDFKSAVIFLQDKLYLQVDILTEYNSDNLGELPELIQEKAAEWYEPEKLPQKLTRPSIGKYMPTNRAEYPIDCISDSIFKQIQNKKDNGQFSIFTMPNTSRDHKIKDAVVVATVSWEELDADMDITMNNFDKRILIAYNALLSAGNDCFTVNQINYVLKGSSTPSADQKNRIDKSLEKMRKGIFVCSNMKELDAGMNYPGFNYDGMFLPFERKTVIYKGQEVEYIVPLYRKITEEEFTNEPPLISFARGRKQLTTISNKLLQVEKMQDTEENLSLQDYLLTFITRQKHYGVKSKELKFETIKKACNIPSKNANRMYTKLNRCLEHYKSCGYIVDYTMASPKADRITITFEPLKEVTSRN